MLLRARGLVGKLKRDTERGEETPGLACEDEDKNVKKREEKHVRSASKAKNSGPTVQN